MKALAFPPPQAMATGKGSATPVPTEIPQRAPGAVQESCPLRGSSATTLRVFEPRVANTARGVSMAVPHASASGTAAPHASVRARARSPPKDRTLMASSSRTVSVSTVTGSNVVRVPPVVSS